MPTETQPGLNDWCESSQDTADQAIQGWSVHDDAVAELPDTCTVRVAKGDNEAAGGSILGLMMLGAAKGDTIEIIVAGDNAEAVMAELSAMVEDGFGEP